MLENIQDFIDKLKMQDVLVTYEANKLKIKASKGAMTEEIMTALKEKKPALLAYFEEGAGKHYDLSFSQERLWFLDQYEEHANTYHMPGLLRFEGKLDIPVLKQTLTSIVKRHEALRTNFISVGNTLQQAIASSDTFHIEEVSLKNASLDALIAKELQRPFDLASESLFRVILYTKSETESYLFVNMHHIITDGWSIGILIEELVTFYSAYKNAEKTAMETDPMPALKIQYGDYAVWQKEFLSGDTLKEKIDYWKKALEGVDPLALPTSFPRPAKQNYKGVKIPFELSPTLSQKIKALSKEGDATLFMTLLSAFSLLLSKYANQKDVVVGTPIANRERSELEPLIGFFVNTLAIRSELHEDISFKALMAKTKETTLNAYEHQDVPFEKIVDALNIPRDQSRSPLFQVMFVLQNTPEFSMQLPEVAVSFEERHNDVSKFDITLFLEETENQLKGSIEYATDLFTEAYIKTLFSHFTTLLEHIVKSPDDKLSTFSLLKEEEAEAIYGKYNDTAKTLETTLLPQQCMASALRTPEAQAIVTSDRTLSYGQTHSLSVQIAEIIAKASLEENAHVAILLPKGWGQVVAVLGCGYEGKAYLPMSIEYPKQRIEYLLKEAGISMMITDSATLNSFGAFEDTRIINIDSDIDVNLDKGAYDVKAKAKALAYTIFTSGSTGKPKGVMITNESVCNTVMDMNTRFSVNEKDRFFAISALNFDLSVYDIYGALSAGAAMIIPDEDQRKDSAAWFAWAHKEKVSIWNSVPALMKLLCDEARYAETTLPKSLRLVIMSGDFIPLSLYKDIESLSTEQCEIMSFGGATEASIWSIFYPIKELDEGEEKIPYGYPMANQQMYILDENLKPKPYRVHGDIYIKGLGVAQGYFNDEVRTKAQFLKDENGEILYKTGDIGYFNPKGYIEIVGRDDEQVKIQGYRVELGEIEQHLLDLDEVEEAVVLAKEDDSGTKMLVSYITSLKTDEVETEELKSKLLHTLPEYMIPLVITQLEHLPLTANAKVDKKALLALDVEVKSSHEYVAPRDETESKLANIFAEVLKVDKVGIYDNFFELGGHSLLATQLVSKIRSEMHVDISLKALFDKTDVFALALYISEAEKQSPMEAIPLLENRENLPLSFTQERLWFIDQLDPHSADYNIPIAVSVYGALDMAMVDEALQRIIARHENLRTVFPSHEGAAQQKILEHIDFKIEEIDLTEIEDASERHTKAQMLAQKEANSPFDLSKGPLLRALMMKLGEEEHVLLLNMHHIISDGWSMGIFFNEFDTILNALMEGKEPALPELRIHYADYGMWQRERLQEGKLQEDLDYWAEELVPFPRKLNVSLLETDKVNKEENALSVQRISKTIPAAVMEKIEAIGKVHNWTLNQILLSLYASVIYRYSNQESMIIGVPNANRPNGETEEMIGFFVNTMLIRLDLDASSTYADIAQQVQEKMFLAIDHQEAPLQSIIENIRQKEDLIDIDESVQFAFNSLPMAPLPADETAALQYDVFDIGTENVKTLLTLTLDSNEERTTIQLSYKNTLLDDEKVAAFLANYERLIEEFCDNTENLVSLSPLFNDAIIENSGYDAKAVTGVYPFTQMQNDLYLQGKVNFDSEYMIGWHRLVTEDKDLDLLKKSIDHVFSQIDLINMRVTQYNDAFYQLTFSEAVADPYVEIDLKEGDDIEQEMLKACDKSIALENGSLVRAVMISKNGSLYSIGYMMHHVIMDGLSLVHLNGLIEKSYKAYMKKQAFPEVSPNTALKDIHFLLGKYKNKEQKKYWKPLLEHVEDMPLLTSGDFGAQIVENFTLNKETMNKIHAMRKEADVSAYAFLTALYIATLYRLFRFSTDVVFFEPLVGRKSLRDKSLGVYMDVRPLVVQASWLNEENSIADLAQKIHLYQQRENTRISMRAQGELIDNSDVTFSINFVPKLTGGHEDEGIDMLPQNEVQMMLYSGDPYTMKITHPEHIFAGVDIKEKLNVMLQSSLENPDNAIVHMDFLSVAEREEQLSDFNAVSKVYDKSATIHSLIEAQVERTPDAVAVVFEEKTLSYRELNEKANQLASYLLEKGVEKDEIVAVCMDRSLEMVIGLLAILKAGAAYVPVDPKYPADRIEYMVEDSHTAFILTQSRLQETLPETESQMIAVDSLDLSDYTKENADTGVTSSNLAYLIYTSGSTGQPKGVMVEHRGVVNMLDWYKTTIGMNETSSTTIISSLSFDLTQKNIFSPLQTGAKLILSHSEHFDPNQIIDVIAAHKCTFLNCAPSTFYALVDACAGDFTPLQSLAYLFLGGEPINLEQMQAWQEETETVLVNSYGPTESSDVVSFYALEDKSVSTLPIGKPVPNVQLYILDENLNLLPKGVPGELHVAGDGLARGYLNQPELTLEKFIDNPFAEGSKMYKTGDLVKYLDDGNVLYLGRMDDQVKIHGFRIELGEIEQQLLAMDEIKEAVVLPREDSKGHTSLAAYLITASEETLELGLVKSELSKQLPDYMVPSAIVILDEIPLTPNRKVDKKALLKMAVSSSSSQAYVAPRDEVETQLAAIFAEVLNVEKAGIYDNFFELGGHSLLATQLVSKVRSQMHVDLSIKALFDKTDVAALAAYISKLEKQKDEEPIPVLSDRDSLPLSFTQERLWFLEQFATEKTSTYHIPGLLHLKGTVNKDALARALDTIVQRHEVLRTTFATKNDVSIQKVHDASEFSLREISCSKENLDEKIAKALHEVFDLKKDLLFRATLFEVDNEEHYLFINMHHIISDGWSISVLVEEFVTLYYAYSRGLPNPLSALAFQFADYAAWQKETLQGEVLEEKLAYWREALQGVEPLALPTTYNRPSIPTNKGKTVEFTIDKTLSQALSELSKENDVTLFMTLLSAFSVLMRKYSGQEEIAIGSPIANRNRSELEGLIGFFVNTLVLKQSYQDEMQFTDLLQQTKERTLNAYEYQDVPFEKIVDALDLPIDTSRSPLFQVMLVLQNIPNPEIDLDGLKIELEEMPIEHAKFEITMMFIEEGDEIRAVVEYATDLFSKHYIETMISHFNMLLESIVSEPSAQIETLNIITEEETEELIHGFNNAVVPYDKERTIHSYFESQAEKTPNATAIVFDDESMSYKTLNEKANSLAHYLIAQGLKNDELVAISMDRSFAMIISLLAVLKAGGAYVPVDPAYPEERKAYIIDDAKAETVLTQESFSAIDSSAYPVTNPEVNVKSSDLAYVIYTSGTTGNPKGVMLEHRGVVNLNEWYSNDFDFNEKSANLIIISFGFDAVQKNIFSVLNTGGKVVLPGSGHYDAAYYTSLIEQYQCTHLNCVPSAFYPMLDISSDYKEIRSLKYVLVGGEASKKEILDPWLSQVDTTLVNVYGPTECNDISLFYAMDDNHSTLQTIPIGRPVNNVQIYILDAQMQLVPKGVSGELHIAGDAVSRGYLNQEALTKEKFIDNPFGEGKLYKTGDLVKYLQDGNVEYLGRVDDQVKIRGFRIELGEIEQQLLLIDEIKNAVVLARDNDNGQKVLVAYLTTHNNENIEKSTIKQALKQHLPAFMIPSSFLMLETMPFTPNGKVDNNILLKLDVDFTPDTVYVAPRDEDEEILTGIFEEVLNIDKVGINDDFFELGGNSLLSMKISSKAQEQGLEIKLPHLFQGKTVANILELMMKDDSGEIVDLEKEAILDEAIQPLPKEPEHKDKEVFLTGATGFVGRYFLHELLNTDVEKVHCLVRGSSVENGLEKLKNSMADYELWDDAYASRINVVLGDLVGDRLGIADDVYDEICSKVDRIYHSAVYMNPVAGYDFLAEVNVAAIEKVFALASTGKQKPIEYISTVNIFNTLEIKDEDSAIDDQEHLKSTGYAATKFLAEKLVLMAQERGFDISIYRLGLVVGDQTIGKNDRSQWFYKLLNASIELKAMPDFDEGGLPLVPADFVAKSVVALATSKEKNRVYHLTSPFNISMMDLVALYNAANEEKIEVVDKDVFIDMLDSYNETHERLPVTDLITAKLKMAFEFVGKADQNPYLHSFKTFKTLKELGIEYPSFDSALVTRYFESSKSE